MDTKKLKRLRRARRGRSHMRVLEAVRLAVHRTPRHIYAQIISSDGGRIVTSASTVEKDVRGQLKYGGNAAAARLVGLRIAEKAKAAGIDRVAFDRSGFRYHGRVRALAEAAREGGLEF